MLRNLEFVLRNVTKYYEMLRNLSKCYENPFAHIQAAGPENSLAKADFVTFTRAPQKFPELRIVKFSCQCDVNVSKKHNPEPLRNPRLQFSRMLRNVTKCYEIRISQDFVTFRNMS